jgi:hypothetical protein
MPRNIQARLFAEVELNLYQNVAAFGQDSLRINNVPHRKQQS